MNTPYEPPKARLADKRQRPNRRRATWLAVLLGLLTDVFGTQIFSTISAFVLGFAMAMQGRDNTAMLEVFNSTPFALFSLLSGTAFTVMGGYVAARVADHLEYRHGLYLGIASLATSELMIYFSQTEIELWVHIGFVLLAIPAGIFGAHFRAKEKRAGR